MIILQNQHKLLSSKTKSELAKKGINPFKAQDATGVKYPLVVPPYSQKGSLGESKPWQLAVDSLEKDLNVITQTLNDLETLFKQEDIWREVWTRLNKIDTILAAANTGDMESYTETFHDYSQLFDYPLNYPAASGYEIDFQKGHLRLAEDVKVNPRIKIDDASVLFDVYPENSVVKETGSLQEIFNPDSMGWVVEISGSEQINIVLTIKFSKPVRLNSVEIDYTGRIRIAEVSADTKSFSALDPAGQVWVTETTETKSLRIVIQKEAYDSTGDMAHYFCLRGIALFLRRFISYGNFISHAIPVRKKHVSVNTVASLPANTSLQTYIGFQESVDITWTKVSDSTTVEIPWSTNIVEETFTNQLAEPDNKTGLVQLYTLRSEPNLFNIELYPGYDSWCIESMKCDSEEATLASWYEYKRHHAISTSFVEMERTTSVKSGTLYRFYAYVFCQSAVEYPNWRPGAPNCKISTYVNNYEQPLHEDGITLKFRQGWNLLEIIVLPDTDSYFNALFDFRQIGAMSSVIRGSATLVEPHELLLNSQTLTLFAVDGQKVLMNYDTDSSPSRYFCRYYIKQDTPLYLRVMYVMETKNPDFSPVIHSYTVHFS